MTGCSSTTELRPWSLGLLRANRRGSLLPRPARQATPSDPKCNLRARFHILPKYELSWKLVLGTFLWPSCPLTASARPHRCC